MNLGKLENVFQGCSRLLILMWDTVYINMNALENYSCWIYYTFQTFSCKTEYNCSFQKNIILIIHPFSLWWRMETRRSSRRRNAEASISGDSRPDHDASSDCRNALGRPADSVTTHVGAHDSGVHPERQRASGLAAVHRGPSWPHIYPLCRLHKLRRIGSFTPPHRIRHRRSLWWVVCTLIDEFR